MQELYETIAAVDVSSGVRSVLPRQVVTCNKPSVLLKSTNNIELEKYELVPAEADTQQSTEEQSLVEPHRRFVFLGNGSRVCSRLESLVEMRGGLLTANGRAKVTIHGYRLPPIKLIPDDEQLLFEVRCPLGGNKDEPGKSSGSLLGGLHMLLRSQCLPYYFCFDACNVGEPSTSA